MLFRPVSNPTLLFSVSENSDYICIYNALKRTDICIILYPSTSSTSLAVPCNTNYTDHSLWSNPPLLLSLFSTGIVLFIPPTSHLHAGELIMQTNSPSVSLITLHWSTHYCLSVPHFSVSLTLSSFISLSLSDNKHTHISTKMPTGYYIIVCVFFLCVTLILDVQMD